MSYLHYRPKKKYNNNHPRIKRYRSIPSTKSLLPNHPMNIITKHYEKMQKEQEATNGEEGILGRGHNEHI